jgi:hypothetical protein
VPPADAKPKLAASRALSSAGAMQGPPDGTPAPAMRFQSSYRTPDYTAWEYGILRPDVLARDLDLQTTRTAGEVQDVLASIDANLEQQVTDLAGQGADTLAAGIRAIAVPDTLRAKLARVMLAAAYRARAYGSQSVRNEVERQLGPSGIGPTRAPTVSGYTRDLVHLAATPADTPTSLEEQRLAAEVDGAAADEIDRREQSARNAALTVLAQAAGAAPAILASVGSTAVKAALIGLSTWRTAQNVEGVVNVAFGVGRAEEAAAIHEAATAGAGSGGGGDNRSGLRDASGAPIDLVAKVYSAVMDGGTCDECAKWDGGEFPIDYAEDYTGVQCPNPRCAGGYDQCRCVWIYITNRESVPLVPAAKGPLPIRGAA